MSNFCWCYSGGNGDGGGDSGCGGGGDITSIAKKKKKEKFFSIMYLSRGYLAIIWFLVLPLFAVRGEDQLHGMHGLLEDDDYKTRFAQADVLRAESWPVCFFLTVI